MSNITASSPQLRKLLFILLVITCIYKLLKNSHVIMYDILLFLLKYSWFTIIVLVSSKVIQLHVFFHTIFHYRLSQDIEYNFLCLCSKSLLFIYFMYSSVYLLIPNSWFVPPSLPLPFGNHKFVFYVYDSVSVVYVNWFVLFSRFHIQVISYSICFSLSDWLQSIIFSRSIHVAANGIISFFLWLSSTPLYIQNTYCLPIFICPWTLKLLSCLGYSCLGYYWGVCIFSN